MFVSFEKLLKANVTALAHLYHCLRNPSCSDGTGLGKRHDLV